MVIRPIPARLHEHANATVPTNSSQEDDVDGQDGSDDEMFLDADGELSSEVAIDTGLPIRRKNKTKDAVEEITSQTQKHIVFKRKDPQDDVLSDYGMVQF